MSEGSAFGKERFKYRRVGDINIVEKSHRFVFFLHHISNLEIENTLNIVVNILVPILAIHFCSLSITNIIIVHSILDYCRYHYC